MQDWTAEALGAFERASRAGARAAAREPRARAARYDAANGRVVVDLTNGCTFMFPAQLAQGLRGAGAADLAHVEVLPGGEGLHWEKLDADLSVPRLVTGIFGSSAWMRELSRKGGSASSVARRKAARANGKKGGRLAKQAA
ncbi:MAG: DUF2442 domain-containing protein [Betaproteobacteria bacterium]|nr:DUF2442 domain-containing protein [Betaproteobacteria bacterium]